MKKTKAIIHNEKDGAIYFGLYVILPMALAYLIIFSGII